MQQQFSSIQEILDFAIEREDEAQLFYLDLAQKAKSPVIRDLLEGFAAEEMGHKLKLQAVEAGEFGLNPDEDIPEMNVTDYVTDVEPSDEMTYAEALVVAMKREKAAYRLYVDLAGAAQAAQLTDMLLGLANEEAKHKLRFELEYDRHTGGGF